MTVSFLSRLSSAAPAGLLLALVAALLVAAPASAQVVNATIEVYATDEGGEALPGVTVEATNRATGQTRAALSGAEGIARIAALPPGEYDVRFSLASYATLVETELPLRVGQTLRLAVTMTPELSETVTVSARAPLVDVYKSDTSTNIIPEQIEQLPMPDRDFQNLAFIAPGVQRERGSFRFIQGGPVIGSGGNASQSTILVDGADFTDPALGLSRIRFSQDAIREFRVINNRFDAEIGGSAGGALSIVTQTGSNETAGTVFGFYRADSLRARGAFERDEVDFSRWQGGFTLGGPIKKDRTFYFASVERIDIDDIALFRPGGAFSSRSADIDHPTEQTLALVQINHLISANQTFKAKLVYEDYEEQNFRVGGVADTSSGYTLERDNWNLSLAHTAYFSKDRSNEVQLLVGKRKYFEPTNSSKPGEYFSLGNTLITGTNITGEILGDGDIVELRDTFRWQARGKGVHDLKAGFSVQKIDESSKIQLFENGLFFYADDTRLFPLLYFYGKGSSLVDLDTTRYGAFVQDDWSISPNFTLSLGLRYDYDTDSNLPDFRHSLDRKGRDEDTDNIQPRIAFRWDMTGDGRRVLRGGAGRFNGQMLLVPAFTVLQQNGESGRNLFSRVSLFAFGLIIDPNDPRNTGFPLAPDITLFDDEIENPEADQVSLGFTTRLGDTGLFLDVEGIYIDGEKEMVVRDTNWGGNDNPVRPNSSYNQINRYTSEGYSEYRAGIVSLGGALPGGHILTGSLTVAKKENISDDFSPVLVNYPSDPADIDNEFGRSRGDERWRLILTGIFKLPWNLTVSPIYEYGSGQPWNRRLGYDFNGDGRFGDRKKGVDRNDEDGAPFRQLSLRVTKAIPFSGGSSLDIIVEAFNVLNTRNFDVSSVNGAEFLAGPTLSDSSIPFVKNPAFGEYTSTLTPREVQVGLRYHF